MAKRTYLLLALAALALVFPTQIRGWELSGAALKPVEVAVGAQPLAMPTQVDFDGDGLPETLSLANGRAMLKTGARMRWQSPPEWQVRQALITDLNHDGQPEVTLLVWRAFKPWPVDQWLPHGGRISSFHDSRGMSCHIILIGWYKGAFRERWAGSALAEPVKSFAAADLAGNGRQSLITLETGYDSPDSAPAGRLKVWDWNSFGFTSVSSVTGQYNELVISRAGNGRTLIFAP